MEIHTRNKDTKRGASFNFSDRDLKLFEEYKQEQFALKDKVHSDIFPILIEGTRQIRELTQSIAIIAGAIASFTIPVMNTSLVGTKPFAYLALLFLFLTIIYAIYHLTEVIPKELNAIAKQHKVYNSLLDENIDRVNQVLHTGEVNKLVDYDIKKVESRLAELHVESRRDKSLDHLRAFLIFALFSLLLAFIPKDVLEFIFGMF